MHASRSPPRKRRDTTAVRSNVPSSPPPSNACHRAQVTLAPRAAAAALRCVHSPQRPGHAAVHGCLNTLMLRRNRPDLGPWPLEHSTPRRIRPCTGPWQLGHLAKGCLGMMGCLGMDPRRAASDQVPVHGLAVVHLCVVLRAPQRRHRTAAGQVLHAFIHEPTLELHSTAKEGDDVYAATKLHKICFHGRLSGLQTYTGRTHIPSTLTGRNWKQGEQALHHHHTNDSTNKARVRGCAHVPGSRCAQTSRCPGCA